MRLGEKLMEGLGHSTEKVNLLGRWMAHYLAELLEASKTGPIEAREETKAKAALLIIELWRQRSELPGASRPFREFDAVLRTLSSLDLSPSISRYYKVWETDAGSKPSKQDAPWLETMSAVDRGARVIIDYCLSAITDKYAEPGRQWITAADEAGQGGGVDSEVIRKILARQDMPTGSDPSEVKRKKIRDLINALEGLETIAKELSAQLRSELSSFGKKKRVRKRST
jgi:hypothetical protein